MEKKSERRDKKQEKNTGMFVKKVEQTFHNKRWYSLFGSHFFRSLFSSCCDCCKFTRRSTSIGFNFEISFFALILSVLFVVVKNRFCVPSFANICIVPVFFFRHRHRRRLLPFLIANVCRAELSREPKS